MKRKIVRVTEDYLLLEDDARELGWVARMGGGSTG
jgi:hypothetical protein